MDWPWISVSPSNIMDYPGAQVNCIFNWPQFLCQRFKFPLVMDLPQPVHSYTFCFGCILRERADFALRSLSSSEGAYPMDHSGPGCVLQRRFSTPFVHPTLPFLDSSILATDSGVCLVCPLNLLVSSLLRIDSGDNFFPVCASLFFSIASAVGV